MRDYVFAKEISCPSVRQLVTANKKTANSIKDHLLITQEFNKMVDQIVKLTDTKTSSSAHSDKDDVGRKTGTG